MKPDYSRLDPELEQLDQRLRVALQDDKEADATGRIWEHVSRRIPGRTPLNRRSWTPTVLGLTAVTAAAGVVLLVTLGVRAGLLHLGVTPAITPTPSARPIPLSSANIGLQPMPRGSIVLDWNPSSKSVTAASKLVGLTPGSQQILTFYEGACGRPGQLAGTITATTASGGGLVMSDATVTLAGNLASVRSVIIQEMPADSSFAPVCANFGVVDSIGSGGLEVVAILPARNAKPVATADLALLSDRSLRMHLTATHLDGHSPYAAELRAGYCGLGDQLLGVPARFTYSSSQASVDVRWAPSPDFAGLYGTSPSFLALYSGPHLVACGDLPMPVASPPASPPGLPVAAWSRASVASAPAARDSAAIAYDAATQQVVVFGGEAPCMSTCPGGPTVFGDTWIWNGKNWTQQHPRQSPAPRAGAMTAYDPVHRVVVLFGGNGTSYGAAFGDTWIWNGRDWLRQDPAASPQARADGSMAFDSATQQVILFGGYNPALGYPGTQNDTWAWNGNTWSRLMPSTSPPARSGAGMAYDAARGELVLFGGSPSPANFLFDTWTWDGRTWSERQAAMTPSGSSGAAIAYDADSKAVILVGGNSCTMGCVGMNNEMWSWDGQTWTLLAPSDHPPAGFNGSMAYDEARHQLVLFGGQTADHAYSDTWTWSGSR